MITSLVGYRDDKGRLEVEVELDSGTRRLFLIREDEMHQGELAFTALPTSEQPSWKPRED